MRATAGASSSTAGRVVRDSFMSFRAPARNLDRRGHLRRWWLSTRSRFLVAELPGMAQKPRASVGAAVIAAAGAAGAGTRLAAAALVAAAGGRCAAGDRGRRAGGRPDGEERQQLAAARRL